MSLDPKVFKYPDISPYNFAFNSPLIFVDRDGKDGIAYLETNGKTTTLVIKATYHYIEGEFNAEILEVVHGEFASIGGKVDYRGLNVKVRVEVDFVSHSKGSDLSSFDGTDGHNSLTKDKIEGDDIELANYQNVSVDVDKIFNQTERAPDNKNTVPK